MRSALEPAMQEQLDCLIAFGWVVPAGYADNMLVDGRIVNIEWCPEENGYKYFNRLHGWQSVVKADIEKHQFDDKALMLWLQDELGIGKQYTVQVLVKRTLWYLGVARLGLVKLHCYLLNRLTQPVTLNEVVICLRKESLCAPAIILAISDNDLSSAMSLSVDQVMTPIAAVLSRSTADVHIDESLLQGLVRCGPVSTLAIEAGIGLRFTSDYRTVYWNDETYRLTKKQAAVVERLYTEGGRAHKDVLRAAADTDEEIHRIMRNKKDGRWVPHPLWGTMIKSEGNGYYCLMSTYSAPG